VSLLILLGLLAEGSSVRAQDAGMGPAVEIPAETAAEGAARRFGERMAVALAGKPAQWDALWAPGARDSTRRLLGLRKSALFDWTDVSVTLERATAGGSDQEEWIDAVYAVRGTATWEPQSYGVAQAFWVLQLDECAAVNPVVRREAWRLLKSGSTWRARERIRLGEVEVVSVEVSAGVYPGQDAILVDTVYYLRALVDDVSAVRFLLDRRSLIYGLLVNGRPVDVIRGGELGALGLEGFSSESESSFRFPDPLAAGDEVLVKFRTWSPLVHMRGEGFVTSFPIHPGPFRERVWYPVLFPAELPGASGGAAAEAALRLRFPQGALVALDPAVPEADGPDPSFPEEETRVYRRSAHARDFDFFLIDPGVDLERVNWDAYDFSPFRLGGHLPFLPSLGGGGGDAPIGAPEPGLDPHPRSRRAVLEPLLTASTYSSQDLTSELEELVPLDLDGFDELFDDSAADADRGAGEPDRD
jgi:hypothetical protein